MLVGLLMFRLYYWCHFTKMVDLDYRSKLCWPFKYPYLLILSRYLDFQTELGLLCLVIFNSLISMLLLQMLLQTMELGSFLLE